MTQPIALYDVARCNKPYEHGLLRATSNVLNSGQVIAGPRLHAFEDEFTQYCGTTYCIGVGNGLDALTLALQAVGVERGDEVIVPAFTFIATWFAVSTLGAVPVPVDVRDDANIDPFLIEAAITPRTKAIVPVHLYGRLAAMKPITALAKAYGIKVVEDAAQSHGAMRGGIRAGAFGDAAAFSFYPTKNLGALGDGGAVTTDNADVAADVRRRRNYGSERKYDHQVIGVNSRLDELQAAYLSVKLRDLDASNQRRRAIAARYRAGLRDAGVDTIIGPDSVGMESVWHLFALTVPWRDRWLAGLAAAGVLAGVHYPTAPFDSGAYKGSHDRRRYPIACKIAATTLSLPMASYLEDIEIDLVLAAVIGIAVRQGPVGERDVVFPAGSAAAD